jgi:hypothetical protein
MTAAIYAWKSNPQRARPGPARASTARSRTARRAAAPREGAPGEADGAVGMRCRYDCALRITDREKQRTSEQG